MAVAVPAAALATATAGVGRDAALIAPARFAITYR
jgi:hypothetical protein